MKDLEKNVNYDLTNCTDEQLKQICDWLRVNDDWLTWHCEELMSRRRSSIRFDSDTGDFLMSNCKGEVCATTLFENQSDNFDTAYNETIERFKKLGYSIDIVIKGYDNPNRR